MELALLGADVSADAPQPSSYHKGPTAAGFEATDSCKTGKQSNCRLVLREGPPAEAQGAAHNLEANTARDLDAKAAEGLLACVPNHLHSSGSIVGLPLPEGANEV